MTAFSNTNIPIQLCRQLFQITTTICKVILDVALAIAYDTVARAAHTTYNKQTVDVCIVNSFIHFDVHAVHRPQSEMKLHFQSMLAECIWLCVLFALLPVV